MYKSTWTIYPEDCNHHEIDGKLMVHGGTVLLKMDRVAAEHVRTLLYETPCDYALTVGVDKVCFYFGAKLGDYIILESIIETINIKRITVKVSVYVEEKGGKRKLAADGLFSFCSFKNGKSFPHGIEKVKDYSLTN